MHRTCTAPQPPVHAHSPNQNQHSRPPKPNRHMYNTRSRARGPQRAQQPPFPPFGRQPPGPGGARGRRGGQDAYLIYSLLSAIYQRCVVLWRCGVCVGVGCPVRFGLVDVGMPGRCLRLVCLADRPTPPSRQPTTQSQPPVPLTPNANTPTPTHKNSLSQLERPVPITCALLAINITAFYIPELFLPFGINFLEIGAICLQPARIVKLMAAPPTVYSSYGGRGMGWDDWLSSFLSFGQTPGGAVSASAATRWQEAASRVWLSAFVHGDQLHIYYNMVRFCVSLWSCIMPDKCIFCCWIIHPTSNRLVHITDVPALQGGQPRDGAGLAGAYTRSHLDRYCKRLFVFQSTLSHLNKPHQPTQQQQPFLALVLFAWLVSHALILVSALALHAFGLDGSYYSCAVGFSAVLFALKVHTHAHTSLVDQTTPPAITTHQTRPTTPHTTTTVRAQRHLRRVGLTAGDPHPRRLGLLGGALLDVAHLAQRLLPRPPLRCVRRRGVHTATRPRPPAAGGRPIINIQHTNQHTNAHTGILAGVLWLDATRVASFLKRTYAALSALVTGTRPGTRYTYMRAPSGRRVPTPSAPPAGAGAAAGASAPPAGHGGNGGVEDELLAEAIRRSLAEQQQSQARAQQAAAVGYDMYRPLAPHVPVATVVSDEAGPRLPSYEEATARNRRRG